MPGGCRAVAFSFVRADAAEAKRTTENALAKNYKTAGEYLDIHVGLKRRSAHLVKSSLDELFRLRTIDSYLSRADIIAFGTMALGTAADAAACRRPIELVANGPRGGGTPRFPGSKESGAPPGGFFATRKGFKLLLGSAACFNS